MLLRSYGWIIALACALAFLCTDSVVRLRRVAALTTAQVGAGRVIAGDAATASGYESNQHDVVLGRLGIDGYHWIMQTQQMAADGGLRVRSVDYDGPPGGRSVHWSSLLPWWMTAVAKGRAVLTGEPIGVAIERVAPWANTLLLALGLVVIVPIVAWRFGSVAASLASVGAVSTYPTYEAFAVGNLDHHGIAAAAAALSVLFLLGGHLGSAGGSERARAARWWFVASGVAGATGLWVSAATQVPTLIAVGVAVVAMTGWSGRKQTTQTPWSVDPQLWRVWGFAGGVASLAFYAIEYLPAHIGLRLEVNHPLYALAWIAGGDLLCRFVRAAASREPAFTSPRAIAGVALDCLAIAAVPLTVLFVPESFSLRGDSLLVALHEDYIDEFRPLLSQLRGASRMEVLAGLGVLPLVGGAAALVAVLSRRPSPAARAMIGVSVAPALMFTVLSLRHGRWFGIATTLWLVVLVALAFASRDAGQGTPGVARKALVAFALANAFVPFPVFSIQRWLAGEWVYPAARSEMAELVTRDVARKLRSRLGDERGLVATGPTTTTWMIYHGGVRGIGTLYWENRDGLASAAALFGAVVPAAGAAPDDLAYGMVQRLGVTHIALVSWGPFMREYAALARGLRARDAGTAGQIGTEFGPQLLAGNVPRWLRPLPYRVPALSGLEGDWLLLLEVVPEQSAAESGVRVAQYTLALGDVDLAVRQLNAVTDSAPAYLPAQIVLARIEHDDPSRGDFAGRMTRVRELHRSATPLAFEDAISLAGVYSLAGDSASARAVLTDAIQRAELRDVRRLPWDYTSANLLVLVRQLGLEELRPDVTRLAWDLLDPPVRAQVGPFYGAAQ